MDILAELYRFDDDGEVENEVDTKEKLIESGFDQTMLEKLCIKKTLSDAITQWHISASKTISKCVATSFLGVLLQQTLLGEGWTASPQWGLLLVEVISPCARGSTSMVQEM